jgi:predicted PurR-regulated permease PerM
MSVDSRDLDAVRPSLGGMSGIMTPSQAVDTPFQCRTIVRDLLVVAAIGAGIWIAHRLGRIVLVLILAMFLAYVIAPLVELVQRQVRLRGRRRRLPRAAAVAVVYLLLAAVSGAVVALLWTSAAQQLSDAIARVPVYTESFRASEHGWTRYYERLRIPIELRHGIDQSVLGAGDATVAYARGSLLALVGMLSNLPWLILVPVFAFLMLKDAADIRRAILTTLPHDVQLRGHRLFAELNATLAAYVRAQLIACVVVGTLCGVGLALLHNPYAILLGIFAGVLECVPLVGPLVVAVVAIGVAALGGPMFAVWTAMFLTVVRVVEDYVIYPRLIGRNIHLHPLVIILAVLVGAELGGIAGVLTAVPVVALATVVWRHWRERDDEHLPVTPPAPAEAW